MCVHSVLCTSTFFMCAFQNNVFLLLLGFNSFLFYSTLMTLHVKFNQVYRCLKTLLHIKRPFLMLEWYKLYCENLINLPHILLLEPLYLWTRACFLDRMLLGQKLFQHSWRIGQVQRRAPC